MVHRRCWRAKRLISPTIASMQPCMPSWLPWIPGRLRVQRECGDRMATFAVRSARHTAWCPTPSRAPAQDADDNADYQTAYQSARTVGVNGGRG